MSVKQTRTQTPEIISADVEREAVASTAEDSWIDWRQHTAARIALGRAGSALPSREILSFGLAHAQARDAIHTPLDTVALQAELQEAGWPTLVTRSQAIDRAQYLMRPDLGRRLAEGELLSDHLFVQADRLQDQMGYDLAFVVGDGLSSIAVQRHVMPLLHALKPLLDDRYCVAPVVIATQARVALADEIGAQIKARLVAMLIGERPGLSSPDSLGIYLTYAPRVGRHDAERNCISNVRPAGLDYAPAAFKLHWLITQALQRGLTGVDLKDESDLSLASVAAAQLP